MFEALSAWREVVHLSEWTGLSVGALAGLGALAWLFPPARALAIVAGVAVATGYGGVITGNHTGRADVQAQWDVAKAAAAAASKAEDADAQKALDAKYLKAQNDDLQQQVRDYESKMVGMAAGTCVLGSAPLRLRGKPK